MSWTRVSAVMPGVLVGLAASCAKVERDEPQPPLPSPPVVSKLDPEPGPVPPDARFRVEFSSVMDEGQLLAAEGRSETVVLAAQANVESAVAALRRGRPTAHERQLFVAATATVPSGAHAIELQPAQPLDAGAWFLLLSPRLRDAAGRKMEGNGARFEYTVASHAPAPALVAPKADSEAPGNLARVFIHAEAPAVTLVDDKGAVVAGPVEAHGDAVLPLAAPLVSGSRYHLSAAGTSSDGSFVASACRRDAPVSVEGGKARLFVRETSADVLVVLDGPAELELQLAQGAADGRNVHALVPCAPPPCGPPAFVCEATVRLEGLSPASRYSLRVLVRDLQGLEARTQAQPFDTAASVPRVIVSEVMAKPAGPVPRSEGEYVELLNLGPGGARLDGMALIGADGRVRPLVAVAPPLPVVLAPGERALAVGASFDAARYPSLPPGTPVLRAATQRLLGTGLHHDPTPALRLVLPAAVPIELASYPGGSFTCPEGASLQRDESLAPDANAPWHCGVAGGTPGRAP